MTPRRPGRPRQPPTRRLHLSLSVPLADALASVAERRGVTPAAMAVVLLASSPEVDREIVGAP